MPYVFVAPAVLALVFLFVYPIIRLVEMSTSNASLTTTDTGNVGWQNYGILLHDPVVRTALGNTLVFTTVSVGLHLLFGLALAILLNQKINALARSVFRGILIVPWMFTATIVAIDWRLILHAFGVVNGTLTALGLMNAAAPVDWLGLPNVAMPALILVNLWRGYPVIMLMLLAGLQSVPYELYEAAAVDGADRWAQFRCITLPVLKPVLASVALLDAIWNFRLFDLVYLTTGGGPMGRTQVLATYVYRLAFESFQFGQAAALSILVVAFTLVLALAYLRFQHA